MIGRCSEQDRKLRLLRFRSSRSPCQVKGLSFNMYAADNLMRLIITLMLLSICLSSMGQTFPSRRIPLTSYSYIDNDTEERYMVSEGKSVVIRNSLPKGSPYTAPDGKQFGYRILWTQIINEIDRPLEVSINFPADSFLVSPSSTHSFKVFIPSDTMTLSKQYAYDYGATGLKAFFDSSFNKPTMFRRTVRPKEECLFYVAVLFGSGAGGVVRAGLVLEEQKLFYRISVSGQSVLIPCGELVVRSN